MLDLGVLQAFRTRGHAPGFEAAVLLFTRIGEHGALWQGLCVLGATLDRQHRPAYIRTMRTVAIAYLLNITLKYVIRRRRPSLDGLPPLLSTVTSLSFPSAHSTTSFAAARSLTGRRDLPHVPLYALAASMALSRVYTGVHYPSDVAAGAALGTAIANLFPPATPSRGAAR